MQSNIRINMRVWFSEDDSEISIFLGISMRFKDLISLGCVRSIQQTMRTKVFSIFCHLCGVWNL